MRIVITGSSGSVGRALIRCALQHTSHTLLCVDRVPPLAPSESGVEPDPRVEYLQADLLEYDTFLRVLREYKAEGLVHLAGYPNPRAAAKAVIHNTNVCLSYNALEAAAEAGVKKVVMASSINAIGGAWSPIEPAYQYFPIDEDHPCTPSDPYSLSKQILELQARSVARARPDMSIVSLRLHAVVPASAGIASAERARKDLWGWTEPEAAGRACLLGLEVGWTGAEEVFVVMDEHRAVGEEAEGLRERFWGHVEVRNGNGKLEGVQSFYSNERAEKVLGWRPVGGRMPGGKDGEPKGGD